MYVEGIRTPIIHTCRKFKDSISFSKYELNDKYIQIKFNETQKAVFFVEKVTSADNHLKVIQNSNNQTCDMIKPN